MISLVPCPQAYVLQVDVQHRGQVSLRGAQTITVMSLNSTMLSGRVFPDALPSSKAKLIGRPKGLQCRVNLLEDN